MAEKPVFPENKKQLEQLLLQVMQRDVHRLRRDWQKLVKNSALDRKKWLNRIACLVSDVREPESMCHCSDIKG